MDLQQLSLIRAFLIENKGKALTKLLKEVEVEILDLVTESFNSPATKVCEEVFYDGVHSQRTGESTSNDSASPVDVVKVEAEVEPNVAKTSKEETSTSPTEPTELKRLRELFKIRKLPIALKPGVMKRRNEEQQLLFDGYTSESIVDYILTGNKADLLRES